MSDYSEIYTGMTLDDRYEILEKIGEGGMALVYKANDTRLHRQVAVKVMRKELMGDEEFIRRFTAESHAVAQLSHPNIVSVFDVSRSDGFEYIVLELLSGITLRQYMDRKIQVPWKEALHFSRQIAQALKHAHEHGIIHRDIKPQNIMLLQDGTIKVADFGIAALEHEMKDEGGQAIGSLNYIAPEQARGSASDARGDIYSLGVVMYEMLCGVKPYTGKTASEIVFKQTTGDIRSIIELAPETPLAFAEIAMTAMSPYLGMRWQSADELCQALDDFTSSVLKAEGRYKEPEKIEKPLKVTVTQNVNLPPVEYIRSVKKTGGIGFSLGSFALLLTTVIAFCFVWKYWLESVFSPAERMTLPSFVGTSAEYLMNDVALQQQYNFTLNQVVNTDYPAGTVLSQNPKAGRSLMINDGGIDVTLNVSTGFILTEVEDVVGLDYREANLKLQNAGFRVETETVMSSTVEKDLVISTSPGAGEQISSGSTIYVAVSGGEQTVYTKMPNLIGLSENAAIVKLQNAGFTYGSSNRQESDYESGTVIAQSIIAFAEAEEHSTVVLTVSSGPSYYEDYSFTPQYSSPYYQQYYQPQNITPQFSGGGGIVIG